MLNLDLNNIKAFVAVADHGSFSEAANRLYITQPAVSKRVSSMETALSAKLFNRIGRRIILTEIGETILPKCRSILETLDDTQRIIHNLSGQISGSLSLGTSHHIGLHRLPPMIRQFTHLYPDVELDIQFLSSEQVCEMVISGDLELGIITLPTQTREHLQVKKLWHDKMQFVVNSQHALSKKTHYDLKDIAQYNAILPEQGTYTHSIIQSEFDKCSLELRTKFPTNYLETIKMMVSVGLGWSVLPETMIDKELCTINIKGINLSRELGSVVHDKRILSNAAIAMTKLLNHDVIS